MWIPVLVQKNEFVIVLGVGERGVGWGGGEVGLQS